MIDKVIQGLECCLSVNDKDCAVCPYDTKEPLCTLTWMSEALEVLKEIEKSPIAVTKVRIGE